MFKRNFPLTGNDDEMTGVKHLMQRRRKPDNVAWDP